jgi:uncharacterized coiled-coil protein SlyX
MEYLRSLRSKWLDLWNLTTIVEDMMATIDQIQADVAALQDASAAAANELEDLTNIISELQAGVPVTEEQLNNLHDSLQSVTTQLTAATQAADESEPPHAAPTA